MASVCLKEGTFYAGLVREKFPAAEYVGCPGTEECIEALKNEDCVLYADDELQLRYEQALDTSVEVTREQFNTQVRLALKRISVEWRQQLTPGWLRSTLCGPSLTHYQRRFDS